MDIIKKSIRYDPSTRLFLTSIRRGKLIMFRAVGRPRACTLIRRRLLIMICTVGRSRAHTLIRRGMPINVRYGRSVMGLHVDQTRDARNAPHPLVYFMICIF